MIEYSPSRVFCKNANAWIDPHQEVPLAIITHGHTDHARWGINHYYATPETAAIMRIRLGENIRITEVPYHHPFKINQTVFTLLPAGHILGSAQVKIDYNNHTTIVTGDFKCSLDKTVVPFETHTCNTLILETTFALPIYHWQPQKSIFKSIESFWKNNQSFGTNTVLYAYSLGKAQRLLAGLDSSIGPMAIHGSISKMNEVYAKFNRLNNCPPTLTKDILKSWTKPGLIIAPPSTMNSIWLNKCKPYKDAIVSGWMSSTTKTRQKNCRGFALSDHADWSELIQTVKQSQATTIGCMHGYTNIFARYCQNMGLDAFPITELVMERSDS